MAESMTGRCRCGRIRDAAQIAADKVYLCDCRMCRRARGGVSVALRNRGKGDVAGQQKPDPWAVSAIAQRGFCSHCGTPPTFGFPDSETMDLTRASFDEPGRFHPVHQDAAERIHAQWLDTTALPRYRTEDTSNVVKRWMENLGRLPD